MASLSSRPTPRNVAYLAAIPLVLVIGALISHGVPNSLLFPLLVCVGLLEAAGAVLWGIRRQQDPLSLLPLIGIFYLLAFTVGGVYFYYSGPQQQFTFDHASMTAALGMSLLALPCLWLGYALNPLGWLTARARVEFLPRDVSPFAIAIPLLVIGWLARVAQVATGHYFHTATLAEGAPANTGATVLIKSLATLPTLAAAVIGAVAYLGGFARGKTLLRRSFWGLVALEALWYFPTGQRGLVIGAAVMALVILFYARARKIPWKLLIPVGLFLALFLFPFIAVYRGNFSESQVYQREPVPRLWVALKVVATRSPTETLDAGLGGTFSRFNDVASVATILHRGRAPIGSAPGETLRWVLEAPIPRAVYPDKHDPGTFGNAFGRAYDVLSEDNRSVSIATTQPGELYLDFGWLGVILGMPVLGAVYRAINDFLGARSSDPGALALYAVSAWPLIYGLETIVVLGLVGVLKGLAVNIALLWGLAWLARTLPRFRARFPSSARTGA